jgi:DNA repair photolyase
VPRVIYREEPCRSAVNRVRGMSFSWTLNPYMGCVHRCSFCYVRAFERRAERPSDERYGSSIRVKTNVAAVLRRELARRSWKFEHVAIGAATDPYQPVEARYRLTRACIEVLHEAKNPFHLITRGPLIVRDKDLLAEASRTVDVAVTFSIPTLDRDIWRKTEADTAPPSSRLRAIRMLVDAGVEVNVGIAPVLPGITDDHEGLESVVRAARDAGASAVWTNVLFLRDGTREHFMSALARDFPAQVPLYESLFKTRAYLGNDITSPIKSAVASLARTHGLDRQRKRTLPVVQRATQLALPFGH